MEVVQDVSGVRGLSVLGALVFAYVVWQVVYAFLLSPVRHVPGPFWSRVSSIPYRLATLKARRSAYAQTLIEKFGPIVVIAPDQVHTKDDQAMKIIYDRSSIKTSFYSNMGSWKGVTTTLGKLDYESAKPTRTNLIQCFQNRNLDSLANNIDRHVLQFVDILKEKAEVGGNVDGVVWFRLLALDIVTDVLWGENTNLLGQASSETTPAFLRRFFAFSKYNALKSFIPMLEPIARYVGPAKWSRLRQDCLDMDVTAREALARWKEKDATHDRDVLSMLSNMQDAEDAQNRIQPDDLPAYMVEMMAAGSSTTSHTAAFACWALANHPEIQQKLRKELFQVFPDASQLNSNLKACQDSQYLDAIIKETMRLWPMIPGPLERYLGKPIEVNGLTVPAGVIASTSALTSGRNAEVYPEPETWRPERWMNDNANERMRLNWTPFGYGSRICPGSNLALTELKYMLGSIFRHMRAVPPQGVEWEAIELADVFAAGTRSGHCWLRFEVDSESP